MGSDTPPVMRDEGALSGQEMFSSLYRELRLLAGRQLARSHGSPLSPTTLIHEAYLGMVSGNPRFEDRNRFMGYAARVMRGLIIDCFRERRALKRGAGFHITQLPTEGIELIPDERELVQLSEAIDELASRDPRLAQLVDLRYFCGYSFEEVAAMQERSLRSVKRDWEKARMLLFEHLRNA